MTVTDHSIPTQNTSMVLAFSDAAEASCIVPDFLSTFQILEAEDVNGNQLLQLITEMRRAIMSAERPERVMLLQHRALFAAESSLQSGLDEINDEVQYCHCQSMLFHMSRFASWCKEGA